MRAFARLRRDYHGKWCTRHADEASRHQATGVYAFENVRGEQVFLTMEEGDDHNVHAHWALHVPPHLAREFEQELWRWIEIVTGGIKDSNAIRITHPPGAVLRGYVLKGIRAMWAETYKAIAEPQGIIVGGRRSGTSGNLARTKRIRADTLRGIRRRIPARPGKGQENRPNL